MNSRRVRVTVCAALAAFVTMGAAGAAPAAERGPASPLRGYAGQQSWWKPYSPPCTERENVFAFTEKPSVKLVAKDRYEITFAVKGYCDVTVAVVDPATHSTGSAGSPQGTVVRHLASGVLGPNAPAPFQKDSLTQTIPWNGKDDLDRYAKEPEKLTVRVMLGLKPTFDKRLGGTSGKNIPGFVCGMVAAPDGVYVISTAKYGRLYIRAFDHDGNYLRTLAPPTANLPEEKLHGMGFIEYEPGKKALHGPVHRLDCTFTDAGNYIAHIKAGPTDIQPVIAKGRLYYLNTGIPCKNRVSSSALHYVYTDGSTDFPGTAGRVFAGSIDNPSNPGTLAGQNTHHVPRMVCSPDGKWIYAVNRLDPRVAGQQRFDVQNLVIRCSADGADAAEAFIGEPKGLKGAGWGVGVPGSDNVHLSNTGGIACDARGRIYVADENNNRIQVFKADGAHEKTIPLERPTLVQVHQKTGALYVLHQASVKGVPQMRLVKLASLDDPGVTAKMDCRVFDNPGAHALCVALDSWSPTPRVWLAGGAKEGFKVLTDHNTYRSVTIWEEAGGTFTEISDFEEEARKEAGDSWFGRFNGCAKSGRTVCDPTRGHLYYHNDQKVMATHPPGMVFDLKSGALLWRFRIGISAYNDFEFDKRGYLHAFHSYIKPGVSRWDPSQATRETSTWLGKEDRRYPECPYDYGIRFGADDTTIGFTGKTKLLGALPVRGQYGLKGFQDGFGVNMRGDMADNCNICYVPKMADESREAALSGAKARIADRGGVLVTSITARYKRFLQDLESEGEDAYFIKRKPGIGLWGATIWTWDRTGELRQECAVHAGWLVNGVKIDEDGAVYFITSYPRSVAERPFLNGRGGILGVFQGKKAFGESGGPVRAKIGNHFYFDSHFLPDPHTGTYIKTKGTSAAVVGSRSPVQMDPLPARPPDLRHEGWKHGGTASGDRQWVEGDMEWMYAGASPIVPSGCSCPTMRPHLDWYKRSYVPEMYRHSIGILDTAGNLIMHLGKYGNLDSGNGPDSAIPVGGDDIAITFIRMVSSTDDYLCFADHCERIAVLKLDYHAEETVAVNAE